jgi:hypothetical protein
MNQPVHDPARRRWPVVALAGAILVSGLVGLYWWTALSPIPFDRAAWNAAAVDNDFRRHRMADAFVQSQSLDGKTRVEIVAMLGEPPAHLSSERELTYMLGSSRFMPFGADLLSIRLNEDGRVSELTIWSD